MICPSDSTALIAVRTSSISTFSEKFNPIIVPPLKSIPRLIPNKSNTIDPIPIIPEIVNPAFLNAIKFIFVFSINFILDTQLLYIFSRCYKVKNKPCYYNCSKHTYNDTPE